VTSLRSGSVAATFDHILVHSDGQGLTVNGLLDRLADRGVAFLAVVLALPFVQPLMLPGLSTPFGLILAICGWCMLKNRPIRIPGRFGTHRITHSSLLNMHRVSNRLFGPLDRFFQPRWLPLSHHRLRSTHGLYILLLAIVLSLPLPAVPFIGSNAIAAWPIMLLGLGLFERDGLIIALAYLWLVPFVAYWLFFYTAGVELTKTIWPYFESWGRSIF
jgi:hypothetical protein